MLAGLWAKLGIAAVVAMVCLISLAIIARNWSCRERRPPRDPKLVTLGPCKVLSVDGGASLVIDDSRRSRKKGDPQGRTVILDFVSVPDDPEWAKVARNHLAGIAGQEVIVQYAKVRRFMLGSETREVDQEVEGRGPIIGVVLGESGIQCNMAQVESGYCDTTADAPGEYQSAKKKAALAKIGIWSK